MKTTSNGSSPSLTELGERTTPLNLMQSEEQRKALLEVVELFRARDLWDALDRVLRLEQLWHLRAAALSSNNPELPVDFHKSVALWLESVLNGSLENAAEQAKEALKTDDEKSTSLTDMVTESLLQEQDSGGEYLNG